LQLRRPFALQHRALSRQPGEPSQPLDRSSCGRDVRRERGVLDSRLLDSLSAGEEPVQLAQRPAARSGYAELSFLSPALHLDARKGLGHFGSWLLGIHWIAPSENIALLAVACPQVHVDQHLCRAGDVSCRPMHAQRLRGNLRSFHQEKQLIREKSRLSDPYANADLDKSTAQFRLVRLDHFSRGVISFGDLDRCIRHGTASGSRICDVLGQ
jgi:hypothetical protein